MADTLGKDNPFRYRGYYYDEESGLYYLNSRYYDPRTGRFVNADDQLTAGSDMTGMNLFAYCGNNSVNRIDSSGHFWKEIGDFFKGVGDAIGGFAKSFFEDYNRVSLSTAAKNLPKTGKPGSSQTLPNPDGTPKQKRWYGPDGDAVRDRDYNHPGDFPFPHDHEWKDGKRQKDHLPPSSDYEFSWEPVIGVGIVAVCTVSIVVVAADNLTGVGIADDFLYGSLGAGLGKGLIMIFG